jgi:hypothetical protein
MPPFAASPAALAVDVTVSWNQSNPTGVGGYEVGVGTAHGIYATPYQDVPGVATRSATVTGLTPGTKYFISVRARNADKTAWSAWATEVSTTLPLAAPDTITVR